MAIRRSFLLGLMMPAICSAQVIKMPFKDHYPGSHTVKEKGWFKHENAAGVWKYYSREGQLIKTIDWDKGEKTYHNGHWEPFDAEFDAIRAAADSLVSSHFDSAFFAAHIRWNANASYFYSAGLRGYDWFEETKEQPVRFLLRYDVEFNGEWHREAIEFELDRSRRLIDDGENSVLGFTACASGDGCVFQVTRAVARRMARAQGLSAAHGRYIQYLDWHRKDTAQSHILGEYEWVVARLRSVQRKDGRITRSYDGIVIDPWTGEFKKRIELTQWTIIEANASVSSGLVRSDR